MRFLSYALIAIVSQHYAFAQAAKPKSNAWQLQVAQDIFADRTNCSLETRDHLIRFQPGAIGFFFPHRRDTLAAWYRIGDGPPVRWQDRYPALFAAGVRVDGTGLDDPTAGMVWIPLAEFASARTVWIRLIPKDRPRRYFLPPIAPSLADAARQQCRFTGRGRR